LRNTSPFSNMSCINFSVVVYPLSQLSGYKSNRIN
jgi:hypothetical protein